MIHAVIPMVGNLIATKIASDTVLKVAKLTTGSRMTKKRKY